MDIEAELNKIVISETSDQQMILIKEKNGTRKVPIIISIFEAIAIDRALNNRPVIRPMTHDLLADILQKTGTSLEKITITKIENNTFYAELLLVSKDGELLTVDARPSDSIALGVRLQTPLFVNEQVFEVAGI
jgi:hypothetical protein